MQHRAHRRLLKLILRLLVLKWKTLQPSDAPIIGLTLDMTFTCCWTSYCTVHLSCQVKTDISAKPPHRWHEIAPLGISLAFRLTARWSTPPPAQNAAKRTWDHRNSAHPTINFFWIRPWWTQFPTVTQKKRDSGLQPIVIGLISVSINSIQMLPNCFSDSFALGCHQFKFNCGQDTVT